MRAGPVHVVDRYAIFDQIASGGMATVHLGRLGGTAGFSRTVAIKRMHRHVAQDPDFVSMFLDEARLVARIQHPNVVPTLDVVSNEGELFLVMEYIQGESLNRLTRLSDQNKQAMSSRVAAAIASGVLRGLHAAHQATSERGEPLGIVHRDVSPQNIMVGIDGVARVLDFGVAKARGRVATTQKGQLKGKIAYMSPEQVTGASIDHRSDVFAVGIVLWELLCGRRLFDAENEALIITKLQTHAPAAPSSVDPNLAGFDRIVAKALTRDPEERYPNARAMADDLDRSLPVASASEVGDWVEEVAGKALAKRAARVSEIESGSFEALAAARASSPFGRASIPSAAPYDPSMEETTQDESDKAPDLVSSPSQPSSPSHPSTPSYPSTPSDPSTPSYPSAPSQPSSPSHPSAPSSMSSLSISSATQAPPLPTDRARQLLAAGIGAGAVMALVTLAVLVLSAGDEDATPSSVRPARVPVELEATPAPPGPSTEPAEASKVEESDADTVSDVSEADDPPETSDSAPPDSAAPDAAPTDSAPPAATGATAATSTASSAATAPPSSPEKPTSKPPQAPSQPTAVKPPPAPTDYGF